MSMPYLPPTEWSPAFDLATMQLRSKIIRYPPPPPPLLNKALRMAQQCCCVAKVFHIPLLPPPLNETLYLARQQGSCVALCKIQCRGCGALHSSTAYWFSNLCGPVAFPGFSLSLVLELGNHFYPSVHVDI